MDTKEIKAALIQLNRQDNDTSKLIDWIVAAMEVQNKNLDHLMTIVEAQGNVIAELNRRVAAIAPFVPKCN